MKESLSRREWFTRLGRIGGLAALGAVAAKLLKSAGGVRSTSLCSRCPVVPWCDKPEAATVRRRGDVRIPKAHARDARPLCEDGPAG